MRFNPLALVPILILICTACSKSGGGGDGPAITLQPDAFACGNVGAILEQVRLVETGAAAVFVDGTPPAGAAGAATIQAAGGSGSVATGGTSVVTLTASEDLDEIFVRVAGQNGFWRIDVDQVLATYTLLLTVTDELCAPLAGFDCIYGGSAGGAAAEEFVDPVDLIEVGTGDVKVTLQWGATNDLDLHVVDPFGFEIFFQFPQSPSGGTLDFDSNIGCDASDPGIENIFWPTGGAPAGTYRVVVDNFQACDPVADYTVTIKVGDTQTVFQGQLLDNEDEDFITEFAVN